MTRINVLVLLIAGLTAAGAIVNVHLVPHTHDDVGWLKTVDEYYAGLNNSIQNADVHRILDTVIRCLAEDPDRTFTYVEQAFFQRWWREQAEPMRNLTRRLVKNGQLEFTNGGWCMHDEAAPHYVDMIDQTTLGHKFLMDEFGAAPKTGWQLDPFGHSATQAALLSAEVGFQGLFFGRIDYQDLQVRRQKRETEFIWRASPSLGKSVQVFSGLTGEYGGNYGPPEGFNWDVDSNDDPIQDDPRLEDYNVKSRVEDFVRAAMSQANETRGTDIMMTMGSDFQYKDAFTWFFNLDKLIQHVNEDGRVKAFYSTPARYVAAKAAQTEQIAWPLKEDDFFPYADSPHQFWTGYFTSRPALKRYIRDTSVFFQVAKQVDVLAGGAAVGLERLAEALGVAQHHDAVSGTAKQHVTFDYAKRLAIGKALAVPGVSQAMAHLTKTEKAAFVVCDLRNVSVCAPTQAVGHGTDRACFALWNGLAHERQEIFELPVNTTGSRQLHVISTDGHVLPSQIVPSLPSITNYGAFAGGAPDTLLVAVELPALGFRSLCLEESSQEPAPKAREVNLEGACTTLENKHLSLFFCNGTLSRVIDKNSGTSTKAVQSWRWYNASVGNDISSQASGAYVFRPNRSEDFPVHDAMPTLRIFRGVVADEVHQMFGKWVHQRVRLAHDAQHAEFTYTVGEIPIQDGLGKEVISRISTDLRTNGECFTDSNGREMLKRKRNFRPTWPINQTEEVAGNYFPITTSLYIQDQHAQLTILTDTSQAGTGCVHDGDLELMVHRRLLRDDEKGVGEPLNETEFVTPYVGANQGLHYGPGLVIRGQHLLTFSDVGKAAAVWRPLMDRLYIPLVPFFNQEAALAQDTVASYSALKSPLPAQLELVSLGRWGNDGLVLLRIAHQYGIGEDLVLSQPVSFDIKTLFQEHRVVTIVERGLAATVSREAVLAQRIKWRVEGEDSTPARSDSAQADTTIYEFGPLQIRTFLVKLELRAGQAVYI